MVIYKCPKCGKDYKTQGSYYQKHIKNCIGNIPKPKSNKKSKSQNASGSLATVLKRFEIFETRLSSLERKFNRFNISNRKIHPNKEVRNLPINNEKKLVNIIKKIVNENSNLYSIKGMMSLKELRDNIRINYNLSETIFEELMLKLYRRELIDLQAGGNPKDYQLKSPTGKMFYYLRVKEN